ncbi:MAG: tmk [Frankiales bacterium]|nr:tmk [Frankiales bacterium]
MESGHHWPGALAHRGFRRLSLALLLSSFGDWLGFLATTALAAQLVDGFEGQSFAIGAVLAFRLLPGVVLAPLVGVVADRFDRRVTMVVCDLLRFGLFLSMPLVGTLTWLLVASALVEVLSLIWIPAKEASVPHLAKEQLESANQISLFATYGTAPLAAVVFGVLGVLKVRTHESAANIGLFVDAGTFLFAAVQVARIREIPSHSESVSAGATPSVVQSVREGLRFARSSRLVRGLLVGMLGALAATGVVVGNGKTFSDTVLNGGEGAFALLFGSVFVGIALGVALGPRLVRDVSRRRVLGPAIVGAGLSLVFMSAVPVLALVVVATLLLGSCAGLAYVTGLTLLGAEVEDALRGRTFGLVNTLMRLALLLSLTVAPGLAGLVGIHRWGRFDVNGASVTLLLGGLLAVFVGGLSYRTMNDRPGIPLRSDLVRVLLRRRVRGPLHPGLFVVFEGGEGAGKSTQVSRLAHLLESTGLEVVVTREPGATEVGAKIRTMLLDPATTLSVRTEALLYAADRAQHVATVVRPALERGAVVISDRYVDSSLAYQGAGRALSLDEVAQLSRWATEGLRPDVTLLLDIDPEVGLARATGSPDRIEQESLAFHRAVRQGFLDLASAEPTRYLVVSAVQTPDEVHAAIAARVLPLAPAQRLERV